MFHPIPPTSKKTPQKRRLHTKTTEDHRNTPDAAPYSVIMTGVGIT